MNSRNCRYLCFAAFAALLTASSACNGFLSLRQSGTEEACVVDTDCDVGDICLANVCTFDNNGVCWLYRDGSCPSGDVCVDGVCTANATDWCECTPPQGCSLGSCVDLDEDTTCSQSNPNGACLSDAVCVAGTCVEITVGNICSVNRLNGLCPSGTGCVDGVCVPISEDPCAPGNPDGLCSSGSVCTSDGVCELVPCSASAPSGACTDAGYYCDDGECVASPCSPQTPTGPCEDPTRFCSSAGECIPTGTCSTDLDCDLGTYCGAAGVCRTEGTCVEKADCDDYSTCTDGTCVRDYSCSDDSRCPSGEHCLGEPAGHCEPTYACQDEGDCGDNEYCSSIGECALDTRCFNDLDCADDSGRCDVTPCKCSALSTCINVNACAANADCQYGESCVSNVCTASETCNGNLTGSGTLASTYTCTASNCCDADDSRCTADSNLCVAVGRCRSDDDCPESVTCNVTDNTCSGGTACTTDGECGSGKYCNYYGVCATGTNEAQCTTTYDCQNGFICNSAFQCVQGGACGGEEFEATRVEPNMLILLDRSGSMNESINSTCSLDNKRWNVALDAIEAVVNDRENDIRLGLSTYPSRNNCGGSSDCNSGCNNTCTNGCPVSSPPSGSSTADNCEPGYIDVGVSTGTASAINSSLAGNDPGGRTPTARALRFIANNQVQYGLPADNDTVARDNYILLITDGDPNCESGGTNCVASCKDSKGKCTANCLVNTELDRLAKLTKPIKTYTVGFAFTSIKTNLNCNAVFGGTSLCDASVTTDNCASHTTSACYYQANDANALVAALDEITQTISGCTFSLDTAPPDELRLYVYTRAVDGSGLPTGDYTPVSKSTSDPNGYYTYDSATRRIQLFGTVCDEVREGERIPQVIYGCADPGG